MTGKTEPISRKNSANICYKRDRTKSTMKITFNSICLQRFKYRIISN